MIRLFSLLAVLAFTSLASAREKRIAVFVGLCDNATQGIAKVGAKVGDGDVPEENLYWGCTDGFKDVFKHSKNWKLVKDEKDTGDSRILERMTFHHVTQDAVLVAEAWRGSKIGDCLRAMESAAISGEDDLVTFIGHNVSMDQNIDPPQTKAKGDTATMVLCCKSDLYFRIRHSDLGLHPALYTADYMYPGGFILHAALEPWLEGKDNAAVRASAGEAYAKNQKIKTSAGIGVFAKLP